MGGLVSALNRKYRRQIHNGLFPLCYLCGKPITKQGDVSQDHAIAKAHSGPTTAANLVVAHKLCNSRKGCMTLQEWFDLQTQHQRQ